MIFFQDVSSRYRVELFCVESLFSFLFVPVEVTERYCRLPASHYDVLVAASVLQKRFSRMEGELGFRRTSFSCDSSLSAAGHRKVNRGSHFPCFSFVLPSHHLMDVFNDREKCACGIVNEGMNWSYLKMIDVAIDKQVC